MNYEFNVVSDSCADFNRDMGDVLRNLKRVPFKISCGIEYIDVDLDTKELTKKMKQHETKTTCPSPYDFYEQLEDEKVNLVFTISSQVSGSYQSACIAKEMFESNNRVGEVHVFDTKSATAGQTLIIHETINMIQEKISVSDLIERTKRNINNSEIYFIPKSVDNLERNGRISGVKARLSKALKIIPILGANEEGVIVVKKISRGSIVRAIDKVVSMVSDLVVQNKNRLKIAVSYVNHQNYMDYAIDALTKINYGSKPLILKTGGLSTVYVDEYGLVISVIRSN